MSEEVKTDAAVVAAPAVAAAPDAAAVGPDGNPVPAKIRRIKGSKNITHGVVHVLATFNNTVVSICDMT